MNNKIFFLAGQDLPAMRPGTSKPLAVTAPSTGKRLTELLSNGFALLLGALLSFPLSFVKKKI
jgi:hypothetical protein